MKRRILAQAAMDLGEIFRHISADSPDAAQRVALRLRKSFDLIATHPEIGRPTAFPDVREWSVPGLPYLVPYRINRDTVEILRVWHTSRERPTEW